MYLTTVAVSALLLFSGDTDAGQQPIKLAGVKCPVSADQAVHGCWARYRGGRIFFDCNASRQKFLANQDTFSTKANHQLVVTRQYAQKFCPVSRLPIDSTKAKIQRQLAGVKLSFCCKRCRKRFDEKSAAEQLEFTFGDARFALLFGRSGKYPS